MSEMNWWLLIRKHWGKILGGFVGLVFALLVVNYGFWISIFIFICIGVGLLIGWRLDNSGDLGRFFRKFFPAKDDH